VGELSDTNLSSAFPTAHFFYAQFHAAVWLSPANQQAPTQLHFWSPASPPISKPNRAIPFVQYSHCKKGPGTTSEPHNKPNLTIFE
jgi:hypothetical protein